MTTEQKKYAYKPYITFEEEKGAYQDTGEKWHSGDITIYFYSEDSIEIAEWKDPISGLAIAYDKQGTPILVRMLFELSSPKWPEEIVKVLRMFPKPEFQQESNGVAK